jgi:hypothetical protein
MSVFFSPMISFAGAEGNRATMPDFAYERLIRGEQMTGLFVVNDRIPIRQAIDELLLLVNYSEQAEWKGAVLYLPL